MNGSAVSSGPSGDQAGVFSFTFGVFVMFCRPELSALTTKSSSGPSTEAL
jgi:hypothetical protein